MIQQARIVPIEMAKKMEVLTRGDVGRRALVRMRLMETRRPAAPEDFFASMLIMCKKLCLGKHTIISFSQSPLNQ